MQQLLVQMDGPTGWLVFSEVEHLSGTQGFQAEEPGCQAPRDSQILIPELCVMGGSLVPQPSSWFQRQHDSQPPSASSP